MAHRRQKRRGVLLLVSLVLLVLFLMLGVTFVLMAGNFRRSSEAYRRLQESGNTRSMAENLLHGVARDLVRGTSNPESPFSKENLLEDIYGQPALRGKVTNAQFKKDNDDDDVLQLTDLTITADADFTFSNVAGYYSGLVLTMVTGEAAGQSTRIVGSSNTGGYKLTVMTLPGWVDPSSAPQVDDLILINGRPFSGDGTGNAATDTTRRLNEDYDKADLNNPWLAATNPSWSDTNFKWGTAEEEGNNDNRPVGTTLAVDNDNDSDGTKESLWIDAGLPLQVQSDGSYVKPLVAMLVRDLDGRVNVNAHGSADQLAALAGASAPIGQGYGPAEINPDFVLDEGATAVLLQGRPADPTQGLPYIKGRHADVPETETNPVPGRSGDDPLSAVAQFHQYGGDLNAFPTPHDIDGTSSAESNTTTGQIEFQDASGNTFTSGATNFQDDPYEMQLDTALGSPQDDSPFTPGDLEAVFRHRDVDAGSLSDRLQTALTVGVADVDKPAAYDRFRDRVTTESWDLPVHPVGLPEELRSHVAGLPAPLKALLEAPAHITDLFKTRIHQMDPEYPPGSGENLSNETDPDDLQTALNVLISALGSDAISREMLAGLKFNVNRLFGNGQDDNGNGVVDEPGEAGTPGTAPAYGSSVTDLLPTGTVQDQFTGVDFDHNGDGIINAMDKQARQQYAQQLYLLLMLCADIRNDGTGLESVVPTGTPNEKSRLLARRLAQFAVNAVDYRDADSIMTGFEYDAYPFDATGWDVDGDLSTDEGNDGNDNNGNGLTDDSDLEDPSDPYSRKVEVRDVVWGYEKPVAALTGAMALHDLRIKDTAVGGGKTTETNDDPAAPPNINVLDSNYDQYAPPSGALFLQIYALNQSGVTDAAKYPRELFDGTNKLDLSSTKGGSPVWRVAISKPHAANGTQADTITAGSNGPLINQLRDSDLSGQVGDETMQWNPAASLVPDHTGVPDEPPEEQTAESVAFDNKKKLRFSVDGSADIELERVIYFVDQAHINAELDFDPLNNPSLQTQIFPKPSDGATYCATSAVGVSLAPGQTTVVGSGSFRSNGVQQSLGNLTCKRKVSSDYGGASGYGRNDINLSVSEPVALADWTQEQEANPPITPLEWEAGDWTDYFTTNPYYKDNAVAVAGDEILPAPVNEPFDLNNAAISAVTDFGNFRQVSGPVEITAPESDPNTPPETLATVYREEFKGTVGHYCTAFLQRLADPTQAYNQLTNPYVTVDLMPIDLTIYSSDGTDNQGTSNQAVFTPSADENVSVDGIADLNIDPANHFYRFGWRERTQLIDPSGSLTASTTPPVAPASTSFVTTSSPLPFWPNRPFVSGYELLMVPASEPGKLSFELGVHSGTPQTNFHEGFPYLLNFFYEVSSEPRLGRIFDYLHVPSRYAGTQTTLRPDKFKNVADFAPPFNRISNYREPGRVNLNTIEEASVWESVMHGDPGDVTTHRGATYDNIKDKTFHASPYADPDADPDADQDSLVYDPPSLLTPDAGGPIFAGDLSGPPPPERDFDKNPFFRYGPINRLGNLVGTRSNVYAVWMTLGYFEVDNTGAVTGNEAGKDTGEIKRHRAFYLIDRTIPVGYENGQDHNTEDVFRMQRFIE